MQSVFVGSESHPYAVNPTSSTIAEILGVGTDYFAADLEFACKAATAGMGVTAGLVDSKKIKYGLVVGADTAQAKARDILEFTAGSAAASILGSDSDKNYWQKFWLCLLLHQIPRISGEETDSNILHMPGGSPVSLHISIMFSEGKKLLTKRFAPKDFDYCVIHMPNGKFPRVAAKKLGFTEEQLNRR